METPTLPNIPLERHRAAVLLEDVELAAHFWCGFPFCVSHAAEEQADSRVGGRWWSNYPGNQAEWARK